MSRKHALKVLLAVVFTGLSIGACGFSSSAAQPPPEPPATPVPPTPTPTPTRCMDVILNSTQVETTYQGVDPISPGDVYLAVDVSFQNNCSTEQTLSPSWDLKDASGNHFTPVDPPQPIVLSSGEANQQTTAFEVPGSEGCNFTLYLIGVADTQSWTLSCSS